MPKFHVERSVLIDAPLDKVSQLTDDFSQWPAWSPWLLTEPDAKVDVYGTPGQTGHGYEWTGDLVGAGKMETRSIEGGVHQMELTFLKPFRSRAGVEMIISQAPNNQTSVTWLMDSALPFFMFFMTSTMKAMIGMDYDRGLRMLKELAESGEVNSSIEICGVVDIKQLDYVGVAAESSMENIGQSMESTLQQAMSSVSALGVEPTATTPGAIYHDMNIKTQHCRYTAFVSLPSQSASAPAPAGTSHGTINDGRALKVIHRGAYEHLGNGWSAAMTYQRNKKLKLLKSQPPFELYPDDPETTDVKSLRTEIYLPLRG